MNKKHLILALGLALAAPVSAQTSLDLPAEYLRNNTTGGVNDNLPANLEGSPYLTDDFRRGMVYMENETPYPAMMRYNAYQDEMQVQGPNGISTLFLRDNIWAVLNGETFKIASYEKGSGAAKGYFVELNQGNTRLLKQYKKVFLEAVPASSSYTQDRPPRFEDDITYYLLQESGPAQEVKLRKKDILNLLSSKEAESFVKENKLGLKTEQEVLRVLNYLNAG
jgi:hypothetical protein